MHPPLLAPAWTSALVLLTSAPRDVARWLRQHPKHPVAGSDHEQRATLELDVPWALDSRAGATRCMVLTKMKKLLWLG